MKEGDFIKLDFDAFVKETDQLMDTTHEEIAKEHDMFNERATYGPISVIVGSGTVVKGLDEALKTAEVGSDHEVEIPPQDAFGERDPKLVEVLTMNKILSLPEFRKGDQYPTEGMEIRINNRIGIINRIFAGRVRVDFNTRFAGRTILYKFKVTEVIDSREDKMRALIDSVYPHSDEFGFEFKADDEVEITLPDIVKLDTNWAMSKFKLVSDLRNHMGLRTVRLVEVYIKKEETVEEEGKEHSHECDDPDCDHEHHHECDDPDCTDASHSKEAPEKKEAPKKKEAPEMKEAEK